MNTLKPHDNPLDKSFESDDLMPISEEVVKKKRTVTPAVVKKLEKAREAKKIKAKAKELISGKGVDLDKQVVEHVPNHNNYNMLEKILNEDQSNNNDVLIKLIQEIQEQLRSTSKKVMKMYEAKKIKGAIKQKEVSQIKPEPKDDWSKLMATRVLSTNRK